MLTRIGKVLGSLSGWVVILVVLFGVSAIVSIRQVNDVVVPSLRGIQGNYTVAGILLAVLVALPIIVLAKGQPWGIVLAALVGAGITYLVFRTEPTAASAVRGVQWSAGRLADFAHGIRGTLFAHGIRGTLFAHGIRGTLFG